MHARWLVEIATLFVVESKMREGKKDISHPSAAHRYWAVSRERIERWQTLLTEHRELLETAGASTRISLWKSLRPVFEEVFLSDILVRVLATYGNKPEFENGDHELGAIAHNVFTSHEDVRNRCLRLLVSNGLPVDHSVELNRIRYSLEHWNDAFIAQMSRDTTRLEYCFDPERTAELIEEARERDSDTAKLVAWQLMIASCQKWMNGHCRSSSTSSLLNQQLGESVLAMIHPDRFPSLSPFPLAFSDRVITLIDQANLWVHQLIAPEAIPSPH